MSAAFVAERIVRSHAFEVPLPLACAFTLFEPEGERAWAEGWDPRYLHPHDGRVASGLVFTTDHGGEHTLWTVARHEPAAGCVEYVRMTPGSRVGTVAVRCEAIGPARTRVTATYALTALSEAGNARLRALDEAAYRAYIDSWGESIERALSAGGLDAAAGGHGDA